MGGWLVAAGILVVLVPLAGCLSGDGPADGAPTATDDPSGFATEGVSTSLTSSSSASMTSTGSSTSGATCGWMSAQPCECPWIDGCPIPPMDDDPEVVLSVDAATDAAGAVEVRARNKGDVAYVYRTYYAACDLSYHTDSGRRFLVPEGTHCDIANTGSIEPGATVVLFRWGLDECTRDNWGCAEERDLPPGDYHVRGTFCAAKPEQPGGYTGSDCQLRESRSGVSLRVD